MSLDKPFAVLKKYTDHFPEPLHGDFEMDSINKHEVKEPKYRVAALIKEKIIFKNRPRPIILKPQVRI